MEAKTNVQKIVEMMIQKKRGSEITKALQIHSPQVYMVMKKYRDKVDAGETLDQIFEKKQKHPESRKVVTDQVVTDQVVTDQVVTDQVVTDQVVADQVVVKAPAAKVPAAKVPAAKAPAAKAPAAKVPAAKVPAAKVPAAKAPAAKGLSGLELDSFLNSISPSGLVFEEGYAITADKGDSVGKGESKLTEEQIDKLAAPFCKKWNPKIKFMEEKADIQGISIKGTMVYGGKGHIALKFN